MLLQRKKCIGDTMHSYILIITCFTFSCFTTSSGCISRSRQEGKIRDCCANYQLVSGNCTECPLGTHGVRCSASCPQGHFGRFCLERCNCNGEYQCDPREGCIAVLKSDDVSGMIAISLIMGCLLTGVMIGLAFYCRKCMGRDRHYRGYYEAFLSVLPPSVRQIFPWLSTTSNNHGSIGGEDTAEELNVISKYNDVQDDSQRASRIYYSIACEEPYNTLSFD